MERRAVLPGANLFDPQIGLIGFLFPPSIYFISPPRFGIGYAGSFNARGETGTGVCGVSSPRSACRGRLPVAQPGNSGSCAPIAWLSRLPLGGSLQRDTK